MTALAKRLLGAAMALAVTAAVAGVTPASAQENVVKFMAGYIEGLNYAMSHRDETIALGAKITKIAATEPIFAAVFDEAKKGNYVSPTAEIPTDKLKWLAGVLLDAKKLTKRLDLPSSIDESVRADALKLVKK